MIRRTLISLSVIASLGAALPLSVLAQSDYPTKPVKFIVPFPPGGTSDIMGRMAAE
jgi:tripartite-type tricarboxylate transporter receptor subunit TctC